MVRLRLKMGEREIELEGDKDFIDAQLPGCWDKMMAPAQPAASAKRKAKESH